MEMLSCLLLMTSLVILYQGGWTLTPNFCKEPPARGRCKAWFTRWFWNDTAKDCGKFIYGGCPGNDNRFDGKEDCQQHCADACQLPVVKGLCRGYFPRFFFNQAIGECEQFIYGGCGGNKNNFQSLQTCLNQCTDAPEISKDQPELCRQPAKFGTCFNNLNIRYFFSSEDRHCRPFIFGGCQGNDNSFDSHEACKNICGGD